MLNFIFWACDTWLVDSLVNFNHMYIKWLVFTAYKRNLSRSPGGPWYGHEFCKQLYSYGLIWSINLLSVCPFCQQALFHRPFIPHLMAFNHSLNTNAWQFIFNGIHHGWDNIWTYNVFLGSALEQVLSIIHGLGCGLSLFNSCSQIFFQGTECQPMSHPAASPVYDTTPCLMLTLLNC